MTARRGFWRSFLDGLGGLALFGTRPADRPRYPHASDADALRSDWEKVGGDMWRAISAEAAWPQRQR